MVRLVICNIKNSFCNIRFLAFLFVLLVVNGIGLSYTVCMPCDAGFSKKNVSDLFGGIQGLDPDTAIEHLYNQTEKMSALYYVDEADQLHVPTIEQEAQYAKYTKSVSSEIELYKTAIAQVEELNSHKRFMDDMRVETDLLRGSSFFMKNDSFAEDNIEKTLKAYSDIDDVEISLYDSTGVRVIIEPAITTICIICLMFYITLNSYCIENESRLFDLYRSMKFGRKKLIVSRIISIAVFSIIVSLFFYLENMIISFSLLNPGDFARSIQNIVGYTTSDLKICTGELIICGIAVKVTGIFVINILIFLISIILQDSLFTMLVSLIIGLVESCAYFLITAHSPFSVFKVMNIFALMQVKDFFCTFMAVNVFSQAVSIRILAVIFVFLVCGLSILASIFWPYSGKRKSKVKPVNNQKVSKNKENGIFLVEFYKLFVMRKGGVLLVLIFFLQVMYYSGITATVDTEEYYYREYAKILNGEITEEKTAYINKTMNFFNDAQDEISMINNRIENGEINQSYGEYQIGQLQEELDKKQAFMRIYDQYMYLIDKTQRGIRVQFVADTGYKKILFDYVELSVAALEILLLVGISFCGFIRIENKSGMIAIIRSSKTGVKGLFLVKYIVLTIYEAMAILIVLLIRIFFISKVFSIDSWSVSAVSLPVFSWIPDWLSIRQCLIAFSVAIPICASGVLLFVFAVFIKKTVYLQD